MLKPINIVDETVVNVERGNWLDSVQDQTILVVYPQNNGPKRVVEYIQAARRKGFRSYVILHFGDERAFDDVDGRGMCKSEMYQLQVPIFRNCKFYQHRIDELKETYDPY